MVADGLFLPGYGARASAYARGLPAGWRAVQPPPLRRTRGSVRALAAWATALVRAQPAPVGLAGHSTGGALAVLAAAAVPDRVTGLVLFGPAGLPLPSPYGRSTRQAIANTLRGRYAPLEVAASLGDLLTAPRAGLRLARRVETLDLTDAMTLVRRSGIPVTVVAATTDALVPPAHSRRVADLLGAEYRELDVPGGHTWMYRRWERFRREFEAASPRSS